MMYVIWVIVQNKIRMVYPVSCTAACYGNHTRHQKVGMVRPKLGGSGPPSGCALACTESGETSRTPVYTSVIRCSVTYVCPSRVNNRRRFRQYCRRAGCAPPRIDRRWERRAEVRGTEETSFVVVVVVGDVFGERACRRRRDSRPFVAGCRTYIHDGDAPAGYVTYIRYGGCARDGPASCERGLSGRDGCGGGSGVVIADL